jgi:enoyl-CoA hydratase
LRVAARSAVFGVFCRRWGVPLIDGGTVRLPRLIGQSRALDMILTGRAVNADEAFSFGLANRLVDDGKALEESLALAESLTVFPQSCMRNDRAAAVAQWSLTLSDALQYENQLGRQSLADGAVTGAARFVAGHGRKGDFESL